jgi:hypothetical protein
MLLTVDDAKAKADDLFRPTAVSSPLRHRGARVCLSNSKMRGKKNSKAKADSAQTTALV